MASQGQAKTFDGKTVRRSCCYARGLFCLHGSAPGQDYRQRVLAQDPLSKAAEISFPANSGIRIRWRAPCQMTSEGAAEQSGGDTSAGDVGRPPPSEAAGAPRGRGTASGSVAPSPESSAGRTYLDMTAAAGLPDCIPLLNSVMSRGTGTQSDCLRSCQFFQ